MMSKRVFSSSVFIGLAAQGVVPCYAAELPPHEPVSVLIVSDRVNPHGLPPEELTEPGDIAAALDREDTGLDVESVTEVESDCADDALAALTSDTPPDVFIYFAHRAASSCDGSSVQADLTAAVTSHLEAGRGVFVFHHGLYEEPPGKDAILQLLGGSASGIQWDTSAGQSVVNLAPEHFVTSNGIVYAESREFSLPSQGVSGQFESFVNLPDEAYPNLVLLEEAGEERTLLFGSESPGAARVLGYELRRPGWQGSVIAYQAGEYQPNALDDVDGNNFQILANGIVYLAAGGPPVPVSPEPPAPESPDAGARPPPELPSGETESGAPPAGSEVTSGAPALPPAEPEQVDPVEADPTETPAAPAQVTQDEPEPMEEPAPAPDQEALEPIAPSSDTEAMGAVATSNASGTEPSAGSESPTTENVAASENSSSGGCLFAAGPGGSRSWVVIGIIALMVLRRRRHSAPR